MEVVDESTVSKWDEELSLGVDDSYWTGESVTVIVLVDIGFVVVCNVDFVVVFVVVVVEGCGVFCCRGCDRPHQDSDQ